MPPSFDDRYLALEPLGKGAEGSVWLAQDQQTPGRQVAIKQLSSSGRAEALQHEFSLLRRLRHPQLAAVYDLRNDAAGVPFLVMEHVKGPALDCWWRGGSLAEALGTLAQLLATLDFIHRRGVIHRDVKPANVLVAASGIKLVDFGLATSPGEATETSGTLLAHRRPDHSAGRAGRSGPLPAGGSPPVHLRYSAGRPASDRRARS